MTPLAGILRLSAAFLASNLTRAAIGLGLTLALGRSLGADGFGRWILCTTWASALTVVADLGFGVLLTRDGARPEAPVGPMVASALVLRLAVAIPLAILLVAAGGRIATDPASILGLRLAAVLGVSGVAYGCFGATLRSQPRWLPTVLAMETAWLAVQLAGCWWIARAGGSIASLLVVAILVQVAQLATAIALWRPVFSDRGSVNAYREPLLALVRRALPFAASGLVANLQSRVAPLLLGSLSTDAELGLFAAAVRFGRVARLAPQALFAGALPVLSLEYDRDRVEARRAVRMLDRGLLTLTVLLTLGCFVLARPVLALIYGQSFVAAAPALVWVAVGLIPALSNSARKVALYAAGAETTVVRWSVVALVVQVVSAAALIPGMGSVGAAIGVAAGEAVVWWPLRYATAVRLKSTTAFEPQVGTPLMTSR